jgi:hypothetical protein
VGLGKFFVRQAGKSELGLETNAVEGHDRCNPL